MAKWLLKAATVALGSLLGPACGRAVSEYGTPAAEYGVPSALYKLDGNVVSSVAATPIENIHVTLGSSGPSGAAGGPSVVSGPQGQWLIDGTMFPCGDFCEVTAHDVGDAPGGPYADKVVAIAPAKTADASGNWDAGTFEQHGIQIQLDKK